MKRLNRLVLIQFFLYDAYEFDIAGNAAFLGGNGAGKTSLLDAIQIAMLGANESYLSYNTQAVGTHAGGRRKPRTTRDYCLGVIDVTGGRNDRKRDNSISYISLVFVDDQSGEEMSIGVCLRANVDEPTHEVLGLYVLPGFGLKLEHHVENTPDGKMPLHWSEFAANMRQQYQKMGRNCHLGDQSTPYVEEMLHALQSKTKRINTREYMKIFKKSVLLRDIESIDGFVRDYIVEPQVIKLQKARAQIEHFRSLSQLIEQVRQQIYELGVIREKYEEVKRFTVRASSLKALKATYAIEQQRTLCSGISKTIHALFKERRAGLATRKQLEFRELEAERLYEQARQAFFSASGASEHNERIARLEVHDRVIKDAAIRLEREVSRISTIFRDFNELKILGDGRSPLRDAYQQLALQHNLLKQGVVGEGLHDLMLASLESLNFIGSHVSTAFHASEDELDQAKEKLEQTKALLKGAEDDGARLNPRIAALRERLAISGVKATPVCTLVKVVRSEWQLAIESFLKQNRESFVVPTGQEQKALTILRSLPARDNPYLAQIVIPKHLSGQNWDGSDDTLVGNLLTGDHPLALSYLRAILGQMRCVSSEDELIKHSRALAVDGMCSANFTSGPMQMVRHDELLLGMKMTSDEVRSLERQLANDQSTVRDLGTYHGKVDALKRQIDGLGRINDVRDRLIGDLDSLTSTQLLRKDLAIQISTIDMGEFEPLKAAMQQHQDTLKAIREQLTEHRGKLISSENGLRGQIPLLIQARAQRDKIDRLQTTFLTADDVDAIVVASYRKDIDTDYAAKDFTDRINACELRIARAEKDRETPNGEAQELLSRYLATYTISLGEERLHWRNALDWSSKEHERLVSTELVQREEDVKLAALAAEEAFRSDVAVRMREGIEQMEMSIGAINRTLAACPPFTNGEKYDFQSKVIDDHRELHNYIMQSAESGGGLFISEIATEKIMQLLNDAENPAIKDNPLDDFRCMFRYDLRIRTASGRETFLSKRLGGVGSNGEHRAPFYVIAGAALASAYRLEPGKQNSGAGVMLLDEAFNGMDFQNSLATAKFLESIGLQLVMAAPESDYAKLAPCLQCAYEINRFDLDIYLDRTLYKPEAYRLLTSDMPSEHPDLVTRMVQVIQAEKA